MAKVIVDFECKCFKESGRENCIEYPRFDEAMAKAEELVGEMRENFCGKHKFELVDDHGDVVITVELMTPFGM